MPARLVPGLERRLKAEKVGDVRFDAFTRGRYSTDASHYQIMPLGVVTPRTIEEAERAIAVCRAEGVAGDGARRRHLAGRADRQRIAGHRLLAASQRHHRARCRPPALRRSSRASCSTNSIASSNLPACGFRSTSRRRRAPPSAAWSATIPAARARCATAIRARTCCRSTRCWPTARTRISAASATRDVDVPQALVRDLLAIAAREAGRDRAALPESAAPRRRLQSRRAGAGPQRHQSRASPGRLGRHARVLDQDRAEALAAAWPPRGRRLPFRQLPRGDEGGAAHRQARSDRGRADRPHHARAGPRHRDVQADRRCVPARRSRSDPVRRIRRGRRRELAPAETARRADRRSRHLLGQERRQMGRRRRGARSEIAGRHHRGAHRGASTS